MEAQKIGEVIKNLQALKKKYGNVIAVSASDEEGNSYNPVYYSPTPGRFENNEFNDEPLVEEVNSVCIN